LIYAFKIGSIFTISPTLVKPNLARRLHIRRLLDQNTLGIL
jgi:hypothetical protein